MARSFRINIPPSGCFYSMSEDKESQLGTDISNSQTNTSQSTASTTSTILPSSTMNPATFHPNTITIKLRNPNTFPHQKTTFALPRARTLQTSAYLRKRITNPQLTHHRPNDIIRLNFPDFAIFEIYAEWIRTGEIFTKAALRSLNVVTYTHAQKTAPTISRSPAQKALTAYEDYLGCYFLGTWLQDSTFKDMLVSLMIDRMNSADGHPEQFVKAMKPGIGDLLMEERGEEGEIAKFMFVAVERWGTKEDLERFVPDEKKGEYSRRFVRGLLVWLHRRRREGVRGERKWKKEQYGEDDHTEREGSEMGSGFGGPEFISTTWTADSMANSAEHSRSSTAMDQVSMPPPYTPALDGMLSYASQVSWPSTAARATSRASAHTTSVIGSRSAGISTLTVPSTEVRDPDSMLGWPTRDDDHCAFHEHGREGKPCPKQTARWNAEEQRIVYDL